MLFNYKTKSFIWPPSSFYDTFLLPFTRSPQDWDEDEDEDSFCYQFLMSLALIPFSFQSKN